ncbi:MAG: hypothetical protein IKM95_02675 [Bacteroidales bacterium]|jgi:hypothetical protein|nr:hypothetical protein [Bacteroidales bacterium]
MKRIFLSLFVILMTLSGYSQKEADFTEDLRYFYTTMQGNYVGELSDSTRITLHLTPIWEQMGGSYLYLEATNDENQSVIEQKILEIVPVSDITFKVYVHGIRHAEAFVGKWGNPNFFDGYNTSILKGKRRFVFFKTKDYEYQTNWNNRKSLKCFPARDRIHFKFSREDERFYIKRIPTKSTHIIGYTLIKTD